MLFARCYSRDVIREMLFADIREMIFADIRYVIQLFMSLPPVFCWQEELH